MQQTHNYEEDSDDFDDQSTYEYYRTNYDQEDLSEEGKKIHRCSYPECGKVFRFKSEVSRHIVIHFTNRPYHCKHEGCYKSFKRLDALENHLRIHTKVTPFICDFPGCGQQYTTQAGLRYHILKHKNERAFKCTLQGCGKSFLTASHLRQHQKGSVFHSRANRDKNSSEEDKSEHTEHTDFSMDFHSTISMTEDYHEDASTDKCLCPQKCPENCEELVSSPVDGDFHKLLDQVLQDNQVLGNRLDLWHNLLDWSNNKEKKEVNFGEYNNCLNEANSFFNQKDSESAILDFLHDQDHYNY